MGVSEDIDYLENMHKQCAENESALRSKLLCQLEGHRLTRSELKSDIRSIRDRIKTEDMYIADIERELSVHRLCDH